LRSIASGISNGLLEAINGNVQELWRKLGDGVRKAA
jgi:transposase